MEQILEFLLYLQGPVPYIVAFLVLLACGLGLPFPEDITLFAMGLLSYYGLANIYGSIVLCLVGVLAGDIMIYYFGRKYGLHLASKSRFFAKFLEPSRLEKTQQLFHRYGNKLIFFARFMPGLRAPTYFFSGTLKLPFGVFLFYDGLAAILSVPLLTGLTYYFGAQVDWFIRMAHRVQNGVALLILGIVALFALKYYLSKRSQKSTTKPSA